MSKRIHIHFLHIGKTGGSNLSHALKKFPPASKYHLHLHKHFIRLEDIPKGQQVFFCLRNPITRFVSGFYSRLREGKPKYDIPWTPEENQAFHLFKQPNQLAKALSSENSELKSQAYYAMQNIGHIKHSYFTWFKNMEYFQSRQQDIFFIGHQETLSQDFEILKQRLGCPSEAHLSQEAVISHKTPDNYSKKLEPDALNNLIKWYLKDIQFVDYCKKNLPPA